MKIWLRTLFFGLLGFVLAACSVSGEYPRLVDVPNGTQDTTSMEEKRRIADEISERAASEDEGEEAVSEAAAP